MNRNTLLALLRHGLTTAGGALTSKGLAGSDDIEALAGAIVTIVGVVWSIWEKRNRPPGPTVPPAAIAALLALALLPLGTGCTTFAVEQGDVSPERQITFKLRGRAWFSGQQAITQLKAIQTDKSQSFGTDSISNRGPTNAVALIEAATKLLNAAKP
jgi:hypothetical protein